MAAKKTRAAKPKAAEVEIEIFEDTEVEVIEDAGPAVGPIITTRPRQAYALRVLIEEVTNEFPETSYEVSGTSESGVDHDVTFAMDAEGEIAEIMILLTGDPRVEAVYVDKREDVNAVLVALHRDRRTRDLRETFHVTQVRRTLRGED